jgi:histidyl-tRNA synthetase
LDCKQQACHEIALIGPKPIDVLNIDSRKHFDEVQIGLKDANIVYEIDPYLVRGLDYYDKTVFEFVANEGLGAQNTLVGGGRYDGLFLTLGNSFDLPAIGCAGGIERLLFLLKQSHNPQRIQISLLGADEKGIHLSMDLTFRLRKLGIRADFCLVKKSLKAQMRRADKLKSQFVAIIGEHEINNGRITIKGLDDKSQIDIPLSAESLAQFFGHL